MFVLWFGLVGFCLVGILLLLGLGAGGELCVGFVVLFGFTLHKTPQRQGHMLSAYPLGLLMSLKNKYQHVKR